MDFQASQWGSRDDVRFTINLWVGVPELVQGDPGDEAHVTQRVGALMDDGEDHWWPVDADTDIRQLAEELRGLLDTRALPWLEKRSSLERLAAIARDDPDDFPRYALGRFSMLLARSDLNALAAEVRSLAAERD